MFWLSVCPSVTFEKVFLFAFHGETSAPFAMKLFPSVLYLFEMVIGIGIYFLEIQLWSLKQVSYGF